jgi:GNAT superfamily N-acetyltransferase
MEPFSIRAATEADLSAVTAIALATGQDDDPAYLRHLMTHGSLLVAERSGAVTGYGATLMIGSGSAAISMLADLFVHPSAHGTGCGRAILDALWSDEPRRMTFSSLHSHALPLYTAAGLDAWWPLLYLSGDVRVLRRPAGWSVDAASPEQVGALELDWTGADRTSDHRMWAARPHGTGVVATLDGQRVAAGTADLRHTDYRLTHLALDPAAASDTVAASAVIAVLSWLDPPGGRAGLCLPAPHPATRQLLAAGWRVAEFDLYMATQFGLIDARRCVPSPAMA